MGDKEHDLIQSVIQPDEAYNYLLQDPYLSAIVQKWGKCSLKGGENYFFELCKSVLAQQIATRVAQKLMKRMFEYFNGEVTPEKVAKTSLEELKSIGISARKVETIQNIANYCLEGLIDFDLINQMPDREIFNYLTKVKGVGPWTVTMFLIFAMNRPRVVPSGDFGICKALQNLFDLEELPTPQEVENYYSLWAPHESAASWYLWRSLENG